MNQPTIDKPQATSLDAANALGRLRQFIGIAQRRALVQLCRGEEKQFFFDKLCEMDALVAAMPKTYEQSGKGDDAIACLHYFTAGADFYILEKDSGAEQAQAFGLADIYGDGGELGYISIEEILEAGAELDLHFTPCTVASLKV